MAEGYKQRKREYTLRYQKDYYASVVLHFNRKYEGNLIDYLNTKTNKNEYLKQLILRDMEKEND